MNNLEYLNQISQDNRATAAKKSNTTSLIIKIALGGLAAFVFLLFLGAALGSGKNSASDLTKQLYTRTANLSRALEDYNRYLKSSQLRAIGSSLYGVLSGASGALSEYLIATEGDEASLVPPEKLLATEEENLENFTTALTNAKLNGILDRVYANQIQLQVSLLIAFISQLELRTKNETLLDTIGLYQANLYVIEQSIEAYSNPSD